MFTEADYVAAQVRDAARWLNEALMRANKAGLAFSARVEQGRPIVVHVEQQLGR